MTTAAAAPAKKKFNRADYMFASKTGEKLMKVPGQIDGKAFNIRFLDDCKAYVLDHTAQVRHLKTHNLNSIGHGGAMQEFYSRHRAKQGISIRKRL